MWICCWAIDDRWLCIQVHVVWRGLWVNFLNYQEPFSRTPPCFITAFSPLHPTELLCVQTHSAWGMLNLSFPFFTKQEDIGAHACLLVRFQFLKKKLHFFHSFSFLTLPSFDFFPFKLACGLTEPHQPFASARLHTGTLCVYFKWLN